VQIIFPVEKLFSIPDKTIVGSLQDIFIGFSVSFVEMRGFDVELSLTVSKDKV